MCRNRNQGNTNQVSEVESVTSPVTNSVDNVVNLLTDSFNNINSLQPSQSMCKLQYYKQICTCTSCDIPCDPNCGYCTNIKLVNIKSVSSKPQIIRDNVEGSSLEMEIDTGAAISLIPYQCYLNLFKSHTLKPCNIKLNTVSGPLEVAPSGYN